jgi:hypothetical protein
MQMAGYRDYKLLSNNLCTKDVCVCGRTTSAGSDTYECYAEDSYLLESGTVLVFPSVAEGDT